MKNEKLYPIMQALLAAALFGASAPLAKLLVGEIEPIPLAAFLYLGSGLGALAMIGLQNLGKDGRNVEARLTCSDAPWLLVAVLVGGVAAPIILMMGLQTTPASTASLLLNFESVATALIAVLFFKEAIDKRITWAILLITLASILLTWTGGAWGFPLGALAILAATILWGLDNNFTSHISAKDPLRIVAIKGFGAGTFSLVLSLVLGKPLPSLIPILLAMLLGIFSFGLSIRLVILSMRSLGSARTYALFGTAPFIGMLLSLLLFREQPSLQLWLSIPLMLAGAWLMVTEDHAHHHIHEILEHSHSHTHSDDHHDHGESAEHPLVNGQHVHLHSHLNTHHEHAHTPDLHHRHKH